MTAETHTQLANFIWSICKRGAEPQDFDLIGTEFHRWVRDHEDRLGLTPPR